LNSIKKDRILGIDPGLNITGYGVICTGDHSVVEAGVIRIKSRQPTENRLGELYEGMLEVIESLQPVCMAIEDLYSHYERPKTAIIMGHARGVLLLAAQQKGIPVVSYGATKIKSVMTGNGRASKSQIQMAVCRQLALDNVPQPPDVADALAIALCHEHHLKNKNNFAGFSK
jgi:crossover junction endodeoxyribonuclease RuvC